MPILAPRHPNSIDFFHWNDLINDQLFKLKNQAVTFACVKTFCLCERARVSYLFLILIYKLIGLLWEKIQWNVHFTWHDDVHFYFQLVGQ